MPVGVVAICLPPMRHCPPSSPPTSSHLIPSTPTTPFQPLATVPTSTKLSRICHFLVSWFLSCSDIFLSYAEVIVKSLCGFPTHLDASNCSTFLCYSIFPKYFCPAHRFCHLTILMLMSRAMFLLFYHLVLYHTCAVENLMFIPVMLISTPLTVPRKPFPQSRCFYLLFFVTLP